MPFSWHLLLVALTAVTATTGAAAFNTTGLAVVDDVAVPALPDGAPSPDPLVSRVHWAAPMALRRFNGVPAVGTDETDCTQKGASTAAVSDAPNRSYVAFHFRLPTAARYRLAVDVHGADSLANSFWAQLPPVLGGVDWDTAIARSGVTTDLLRTEGWQPGTTQWCFPLGPGPQVLRLYAREAGTAAARVRVFEREPLTATVASGCTPSCKRGGGDRLVLSVSGLCDPRMVHPTLVRVNGHVCYALSRVGDGYLACTVPAAASDGATAISVTLHVPVVLPDGAVSDPTAPDAAFEVVQLPDSLPVEPPEPFPVWVPILIAAVVALSVAALVYATFVRPWLATRHAPTAAECEAGTAGVAICTLPGEDDIRSGFPLAYDALALELRRAVAEEARAAGCHVARRQIGAFGFVVAGRSAGALVRFGARMQHRVEKDTRRLATLVRTKQAKGADAADVNDKKTDIVSRLRGAVDPDLEVDLDSNGESTVISASGRRTHITSGKHSRRSREAPSEHPLSKKGALEEALRIAVAVHIGLLHRDDADDGSIDYMGPALTECALAADASQPGQVLATQPAVAAARSDGASVPLADGSTPSIGECADRFCSRRLTIDTSDASESDEDDDDKKRAKRESQRTELFTVHTGAYGGLGFAPPDDDSNEGHAGGAVAAQLQQSAGGLSTTAATVLLVDTGVALTGQRAAQVFQAAAEKLTALAERHGGVLHALEGPRLVFSFNAQRPVRGHGKKAALAAAEMATALYPRGARPTGALATGLCTFGCVSGGAQVLAGPAVDAAHQLLERRQRFDAMLARRGAGSPQKMAKKRSSRLLRTASANNANAAPSLCLFESEGDDDEDTEDCSDHHTVGDGSASGSGARGRRGAANGAHHRRGVRDAGGPRFVCSGAAFLDLQQTVTAVVMDVDEAAVLAALEASGGFAELFGQQPGTVGDKRDESRGASSSLPAAKIKASVQLVGIAGPKETSADDEWQYDLAKAEAASPEHAVCEAFLSLLRGQPGAAMGLVERYTTELPPRSVRPSLVRLHLILSNAAGTDDVANVSAPLEQDRSASTTAPPS